MNCTVTLLLEPGVEPGVWRCCLLEIPGCEVLKLWDEAGEKVPFERVENAVKVPANAKLARAQLSLPTELVPGSALSDAKLAFDQQKLAADERAGRRTVWFSLAAAIVAAAATVSVALIAKIGPSSTAAAPPTLRELLSCEESLDRLRTLAKLPTQSLRDLKTAVQRHDDACRDQLRAAVDSLPSP